MSMSDFSVSYYLNDIGVVKYDKNHQVVATHYLPKSQLTLAKPDFLQYSFREIKPDMLFFGNQYKSFQYLNTNSNNYILVNDIEKNVVSMHKKRKSLQLEHSVIVRDSTTKFPGQIYRKEIV